MKERWRRLAQRVRNHLPPVQLVVLAGLGLTIRLGLAWVSIPTLIQKTVSDDSFYYFGIARHIAIDGSVSINGLTQTNGFHPLWLLLISPIYMLLENNLETPIHVALTIGAILDVVTGLLAYRLTRLLTGSSAAGLVAATVYILNPTAVFNAINGMETSLNVLLIGLFLFVYAAIQNGGPTLRRYGLLGIVGGLMMLARSDNIFLLCTIYSHAAWTSMRKPGGKGLPISVLGTSCLFALWLLWNYYSFGTIVQTSATAIPYVRHEHFILHSGGSTARLLVESFHWLFERHAWLIDASWTGLPPLTGLPLWVVVGFGSVKTVYDSKRRHQPVAGFALVGLLLLSCVALLLFHALVRWFPRAWYFAPLSFGFALLLGVLVAAGRKYPPAPLWKHRVIVTLAVSEVFLLVGGFWWSRGLYPWQLEMYEASLWLRANTPASSRIGSFNSGLQAYYSDRTVINLDGVVNDAALKAVGQKRLLEYIQEMRIRYIADYAASIHQDYAPFYGGEPQLELLAVVDEPGVSWQRSVIHIYRLLE